jgi:3-hydroxyisobutyrate dehydrogenase
MNVGFIGLGAMGAPMARNLHRHGMLYGVWNRTPDKAAALATELHCIAAPTIAELARECDVLVSCVSADDDLLQVVTAAQPALRSQSLFIDCSTVSADTAVRAAAVLAVRNVAFLDAPVSGGVEGARKATLAIMVGGEPGAFERARPILQCMGSTISYLGLQGNGQVAKAANQIMVAGIYRAVAEAMAFAASRELDLTQLIATLGAGAAASWCLTHRGPYMVSGNYPAGFRVRLHAKDLRICRDMARTSGATLPVVEDTLRDYEALIAAGFGDEDISAIHRLKSAMFASATAKRTGDTR